MAVAVPVGSRFAQMHGLDIYCVSADIKMRCRPAALSARRKWLHTIMDDSYGPLLAELLPGDFLAEPAPVDLVTLVYEIGQGDDLASSAFDLLDAILDRLDAPEDRMKMVTEIIWFVTQLHHALKSASSAWLLFIVDRIRAMHSPGYAYRPGDSQVHRYKRALLAFRTSGHLRLRTLIRRTLDEYVV